MDNYRMGCSGGRPYNQTCGMNRPQPLNKEAKTSGCNCKIKKSCSNDNEMFSHLQHLEPAMAYVPSQKFTENFPLQYALSVGTVFPQLCKPFCGKRGICR